MKIYTVYIKPEDGLQAKPFFVREGFNVYAFILTGFWMLYHRLWLPFLMIVLFHLGAAYLWHKHILLKESYLALQLGFNFLIGCQANDWLRARLTKNGYVLSDVSAADNLLRAQQRYFERTLSHA